MIASVASKAHGEKPHIREMHISGFTFSANLGFLWKDLLFLERIARVAATGFDALEFHDEAQGIDRAALVASLRFALDRTDAVILIEPICRQAMPGYFLNHLDLTAGIIAEIGHPRLKLMFDCFHIETEHGDTLDRFEHHAAQIGHVQIAGVPGRAEPSSGTLDYRTLLPAFQAAGYSGTFGCEYTPIAAVEAGFGWRNAFTG